MTIREPIPTLDSKRKRLLLLLSKLLDEALCKKKENSNIPDNQIVLSTEERTELIELLNDASDSRELYISLYFVDGIVQNNRRNENRLREIFLSERKRLGRSRALASKQWADFLARLGRKSGWSQWGASTNSMNYKYFLEMEERLFKALGFSIDVVKHLMKKVTNSHQEVTKVLKGDVPQPNTETYSKKTRELISQIRTKLINEGKDANLSTSQITGLTIILANVSTLFTTRDWSAAGTISAIAGASAQVFTKH